MTQTFHYFHPLTPESDRIDVDLGTAAVRLGDIPGWATAAEMGDVAQTSVTIDDPDGTAGHEGDAILGLWTFYVDEDDCPATGSGGDGTGGQRLFTGYITDRVYRRGNSAPATSLIQGAARRIEISLTDVNALASFRIIAGEGSGVDDGNRPAETDVERVQWLISTVWLPVTDDAGWIDTSDPVDMDACDYRGQTPADVLSDCSLASGKNWWIQYFEPTNTDVLWYADSNLSTEYSSDILLSDDLGNCDWVTTFPYMPDAELSRSPARVYAGIYMPYSGGAVYEENGTTAGIFAWRDGSAPTANVSSETKAIAVAQRLLADAASEDDRITCRVQLPSSLATAIKAGQRIQFRSTFMPGYLGWTWMRVQRCTVAQDEETDQRYTFSLELSPQITVPEASHLLLAVEAVTSGSGGSHLPALDPATGWTEETPQPTSGGAIASYSSYVQLFTRTAGPGETQTPVFSGAAQYDSLSLIEFLGISAFGTITTDTLHGGGPTGGAPQVMSGDFTADGAGAIICGICILYADYPPHILTPPSGPFAEVIHSTRSDHAREQATQSIGYLPVDAAGTYSLTWTLSNGNPGWVWTTWGIFVPDPAQYVQSVIMWIGSTPGGDMSPTWPSPP